MRIGLKHDEKQVVILWEKVKVLEFMSKAIDKFVRIKSSYQYEHLFQPVTLCPGA